MGVLLMFNSADSYTVEQIQEQTQLKKVRKIENIYNPKKIHY